MTSTLEQIAGYSPDRQQIQDDLQEPESRTVTGLRFDPRDGSLLLSIDAQNLVEGIVDEDALTELVDHGFEPKTDPHITVLNYENGARVLEALEPYSESGKGILLRNIETLAGRGDWSWQPAGELQALHGLNRSDKSLKIITPIDCPGVSDFYAELEELLPGLELERSPMHITLLKKAQADLRDAHERMVGGLDLTEPMRNLGHLALGYEYQNNKKRKPTPIPREVFPREANGFVDYSVYLEYLVDRAEDTPLEPVPNDQIWMPQHLIYQQLAHMQEGTPRILRGPVRRDFANFPYNQMIMRRLMEKDVHDRFERHVLAPPVKTMKNANIDFRNLDWIAASAFGRRISLVPESLENMLPGAGTRKEVPNFTDLERAEFFDQQIRTALKSLRAPSALPDRVVTSALARINTMIQNDQLEEEVERRLSIDPIYYPLRVRKFGFLKQYSDSMLNEMVEIREQEGVVIGLA